MFLQMMALGALLVAAPAQADDKDTSGELQTWQVTKDGTEVLGSETLRVVKKDSGTFAAGELKATIGKKKLHRKTFFQRDTDGKIEKYQRVEAGLKGAGVKLFLFDGGMRVAPVNASGKPTPVELTAQRVWDLDLWHLYALWSLPSECTTKHLGYFDPDKKASGDATLTCTGEHKVYDAQKKPVEVNAFTVTGVPHEVTLFVDHKGKLVGAKSEGRWMLDVKLGWTADGAGGKTGGKDGDADDDDKVDPGIGE